MLLIENYAGAFPLWLSPVQVNIVPVNIKNHFDYCVKLKEILIDEEIRAELDDTSKQMNYKIRQSNIMKNPYTVIIGDRERDNNKVSYRLFGSAETVTLNTLDFISKIKREIKEKVVKIEK
jgi:threonyl-tRNA synthetase